ncbi:hypothetical protein ACHIPZ_24770 [Antrihabitans sp. NCIMB 15449]|uniref:Helix-turn-helix domain-containing protein n=1 Tax=Antrihabitans spumae TaxID=3373370 RepID=A0ABW7JWR8_9NOCA
MPRIAKRSSKVPHYEVAPGLLAYEWIEVVSTPADNLPYAVTALIEPEGGRYVVRKLVAERVPDGLPVQRGELAKISVEPFIREAAREVMQVTGPGEWRPISPTPDFWDRIDDGSGLSEEDLPQLAMLYRWIKLQDGRPTTILARDLKMSTATVRRWLARAVEAGHMSQEERTR